SPTPPTCSPSNSLKPSPTSSPPSRTSCYARVRAAIAAWRDGVTDHHIQMSRRFSLWASGYTKQRLLRSRAGPTLLSSKNPGADLRIHIEASPLSEDRLEGIYCYQNDTPDCLCFMLRASLIHG